MREIKFRAWNISQKCFWPLGTVVRVTLGQDLQAELSPGFVLQKYTGLKDKNGREIYEGDVVLIPDEHVVPILDDGSGPLEECNHLVPVEFQRGMFGLRFGDKEENLRGWKSFYEVEEYFGLDTWEIIGNIYENPNLLEGV